MKRLLKDQRGAVAVEYLVILAPVLLLAAAAWQVVELCVGQLLVQRAASVAARTAAVVLPDNPDAYAGVVQHQFSGQRRAAVELAVARVLGTWPRFSGQKLVSLSIASGVGAPSVLSAKVEAWQACRLFAPLCSSGERRLTAVAEQIYHAAGYSY